jgi:hypothetical protein
MAKLIGNNPSQIPTNGDLGSMAFEDRTNYITKGASVHQPYRNIIINGDMSIAQRGTSETGISSGLAYHTVDRFATELGGLGTWTQTQSTDVPSGQGFSSSLKMDCTTADASPSVSDYAIIQQRVEGQNLQYLKHGTSNAESLTMSFWVKSNKTGTYIVELANRDRNTKISQAYTINSANTWEKKILTYEANTSNTFNNDNGTSLDCYFWLGAGTNFTSGTLNTSWSTPLTANRAVGQVNLADSTSNDFYITGVQLEAGTTASDFEFLPHDVNLERCQRYFQIVNTITGNATTTSIADMQVQPINNLRTSPTVSQNGVVNVYDDQVGGFTQSSTGVTTLGTFNTKGGIVRLSNFSGLTTNRFLLTSGSSNGITLSAEL